MMHIHLPTGIYVYLGTSIMPANKSPYSSLIYINSSPINMTQWSEIHTMREKKTIPCKSQILAIISLCHLSEEKEELKTVSKATQIKDGVFLVETFRVVLVLIDTSIYHLLFLPFFCSPNFIVSKVMISSVCFL